jgi:hypothetical protein
MSFANMFSNISENREKQIKQDFFLDMALMVTCLIILQMVREADPKGCGIALREWLMIFAVIYFSRSGF